LQSDLNLLRTDLPEAERTNSTLVPLTTTKSPAAHLAGQSIGWYDAWCLPIEAVLWIR